MHAFDALRRPLAFLSGGFLCFLTCIIAEKSRRPVADFLTERPDRSVSAQTGLGARRFQNLIEGNVLGNDERNVESRLQLGRTDRPLAYSNPDADSIGFPNGFVKVAEPVRLTGPETEDDFPAIARAADGTIWMVYVEYRNGQPIDMNEVRNRDFQSLVTTGNGDCVRLRRFDGRDWGPPMDVTDKGLDVWRPTVAVDGNGNVCITWSQNLDGNWELFARRLRPKPDAAGGGAWSDVVQLTHQPGADIDVASTSDAMGNVWLAWQSWRNDNFEIMVATVGDAGFRNDPQVVSNSKANDWSPAMCADRTGRVYVAWDTYDFGNYDVRMAILAPKAPMRTIAVADSARFEARANLACDSANRVWIAYEEGDEQWGKDFSMPKSYKDLGQNEGGFGLYVNRTVRLKCLVNDALRVPETPLHEAIASSLRQNTSLPRLCVDARDGLWVLFRHHPKMRGPAPDMSGEVWISSAVYYDKTAWSSVLRLPNSSYLLDDRPALAPAEQGVLAVYTSDTRTRAQNRKQCDLFATRLVASASPTGPRLVQDVPSLPAKVPNVHEDEAADLARIRGYRIHAGGKTLRLLRGDFHRHTEYTSHRDGDGLLEDSWRYALDAGALDWMGNGDHDNGLGFEYLWWQIQKSTERYHHPPYFMAFHSYERSNPFPSGHRNVLFARRGIRPLPRLPGKADLLGTPQDGAPDIHLLYDYLEHFGGICAVHTTATGAGTDWRDNHPGVEPVVEIFQGCRQSFQSYEHRGAPKANPNTTPFDAGYVWNALDKGLRLGFESSSDHFATHISYAVVLAEDPSREAILDALRKRHCYAANDNTILDVRSGEHVMGDSLTTRAKPSLDIRAIGTVPIMSLHVIRQGRYVFSAQPNQRDVTLKFTDDEAEPNTTRYYYVRAEQKDGSLAWSSPLWIRYEP